MNSAPFPFYVTAISSKDTKRVKPKSALGIQLKVLASNHSKLQVLQSDFCGTCDC